MFEVKNLDVEVMIRPYLIRSSATTEIARDADDVDFSVDDVHSAFRLILSIIGLSRPFQRDGILTNSESHSRSLKVIRCCANRRSMYDFLLGRTGKRRLGIGGYTLVSGCQHSTIQP